MNPMAGVVEGSQRAARRPWPHDLVLGSAAITVLLVASGAMYFRRVEQRFADVI